MYLLVEKKNHLAVHGIFDSQHQAEQFLKKVVPLYVSKSYYIDKALTATDFEVIKRGNKK